MYFQYTNINGFLIPNLTLGNQPTQPLGKYGMIRRDFLEHNAPATCDLMTLQGTLYPHLIEMDNAARQQVQATIQQLSAQSSAPNRKTDPVTWTQWMNQLKAQAEEMVLPMLHTL